MQLDEPTERPGSGWRWDIAIPWIEAGKPWTVSVASHPDAMGWCRVVWKPDARVALCRGATSEFHSHCRG